MGKNVKTQTAVVDLIVNGDNAKNSVRDLGSALHTVTKELREMAEADDPAKYRQLLAEKKLLTNEYQSQKEKIGDLRTGFQKYMAGFGSISTAVAGGNLLTSALENAGQAVIKLVMNSGKLGDELAEVTKQTGLAGAELDQLNDDLGKIDTRTSVEELRKLAAVAGKLGYQTAEDVLSFVKVADMLNVTLAEDLGGNIEDSVNDIGKLIEIFGLKQEFGLEGAMLKTASAINTIGASSAANEGYLVAWTKRFAGIAPNAGISIANTLGMAATLDILGQSSELSATNVGKILVAIGKDLPYFAKVAGLSLTDFTELMRRDANEGFIRVLEGAKSSSGGIEGLTKTLESLGIEGSEGAQVLGALSKNTNLLREQQDLANDSFEKGTSIIEEFNTANNTTGAVLDKINNKIAKWWDSASSALDPLIMKFGELMGVVNKLDLQLGEFAETQNQVMKMETQLPGLIARYEELSQKTNRTKEDQKELQTITRSLSEAVPQAAFEFDKYGNTLQVNTGFVTEFIKQNRVLLEEMRQQKKGMVGDELGVLTRRAGQIQTDLNRGKTRKVVATTMQGAVYDDVPLTGAEIQELQRQLAAVQLNIKARREDMRELYGLDDINARRKGRRAGAAPTVQPATPAPEGAPAPASAQNPQVKEFDDLHKELLKIRQKFALDSLTEDQKQIEAAHLKFEALREKAKGNADALAEINELEAMEIARIQSEANAKELSSFDTMMRAKLQTMNEAEAKKTEFLTQVSQQEEARRNEELAKIKEHYQKLIREAELLGLNTTGLYVMWAQEYNMKKLEQGNLEIEQEQQKNAAIARGAKENLDNELTTIDKKRQAYSDIAQAIGNIFEIMGKNQAEYTGFQKAIVLVQLAIDTAAAIASAVRVAVSGSVTPLDLFAKIAATVAAVTANILTAKKILAKAEAPAPPKFAGGGFTGLSRLAEGYVNRETLFAMPGRSFIAGEAGTEFILSNRSLQVPAVANFAGMMDALQKTRNYAGMSSLLEPQAAKLDPALTAGIVAMRSELAGMRADLKGTMNRPVELNYRAFEEFDNFIDKIRYETSV